MRPYDHDEPDDHDEPEYYDEPDDHCDVHDDLYEADDHEYSCDFDDLCESATYNDHYDYHYELVDDHYYNVSWWCIMMTIINLWSWRSL